VERTDLQKRVDDLLRTFKVVALLGPRQSGKTTLARQIASARKDFPGARNYFDLDDPVHLDRLESPKLALQGLHGLVVIDETLASGWVLNSSMPTHRRSHPVFDWLFSI
jgi:predicted AAA+ superfamily ATPase